MAVREERESVACLSNLVQGAEINSMLFLPFLSLLTLGIQPALSVVCSQHVANRVNDVDACRKSHSVGVATRIPHNDGFFLVSRRSRSVALSLQTSWKLWSLHPCRRSSGLSLSLNSFVLSLELSVRVVRFRLHSVFKQYQKVFKAFVAP